MLALVHVTIFLMEYQFSTITSNLDGSKENTIALTDVIEKIIKVVLNLEINLVALIILKTFHNSMVVLAYRKHVAKL